MLSRLLRLCTLVALLAGPSRPAAAAAPARPAARATAQVSRAPSAPSAPAVPPGCTSHSGIASVGTNLTVPTSGVVTATLNLSVQGSYLWDLDLITYLEHDNSDELDVKLISPAGTVSTITTDNGNGRGNVFDGTLWDDQADRAVANTFFVSDTAVPTLVPEEALGAFIGENPNGQWKLVIEDDTPNAAGGHLGGWSLKWTTLAHAPQATTNFLGYGANTAIPDYGNLMQTIEVSDAPPVIGEVKLITQIEHLRNDDLDILLISPLGFTQTVTSDNGGTVANGYLYTEWYDRAGLVSAPGPVSDSSFTHNVSKSPLVIEGALSAFNGLNPNGTWKLIVSDDLPTNAGTFKGWALSIKTFDCRPDVRVTGTSVAKYAPPGSVLTYSLAINNSSPTPADNVAIHFALPSGAVLTQVPNPAGWQCAPTPGSAGTAFDCTRASMLGNFGSYFQVYAQTPPVPQPLVASLTVTTTSTESSTANNAVQPTTHISLFSENGQPWVLQDVNHPLDDGAILDGGQFAFAGWGALKLRVRDANLTILSDNVAVKPFGLAYLGSRRWASSYPLTYGGVAVSRLVWAPPNGNWLRYVDVFANTTNAYRQVEVAWGGYLGSGNKTTVASTSSGDQTLTGADTWVVTIQNSALSAAGPAEEPPLGFLWSSGAIDVYTGPFDWEAAPLATPWPGNGSDKLAHGYTYLIPPHARFAMAYFVFRGLAEGEPGPAGCTGNCVTPATGTQIALAQSTLAALQSNPPLCDLPPTILMAIANWPEAGECRSVFIPTVQR